MLKSSLNLSHSDVYILVIGTISIPNTGTPVAPNNRKNIIIKNCAPFTNCISEIRNTQIDNDVYYVYYMFIIMFMFIIRR